MLAHALDVVERARLAEVDERVVGEPVPDQEREAARHLEAGEAGEARRGVRLTHLVGPPRRVGDDPLVAVRLDRPTVPVRGVTARGLLDLGEPTECDHDVRQQLPVELEDLAESG